MTIENIFEMLKETEFPVAYSHFKTAQKPPFITFKLAYTSNNFADNKVNKVLNRWQIELYTSVKDPTKEALLESVLDSNNCCWNKVETYINDEKIFQIIYEITEV